MFSVPPASRKEERKPSTQDAETVPAVAMVTGEGPKCRTERENYVHETGGDEASWARLADGAAKSPSFRLLPAVSGVRLHRQLCAPFTRKCHRPCAIGGSRHRLRLCTLTPRGACPPSGVTPGLEPRAPLKPMKEPRRRVYAVMESGVPLRT